MGSVTSDETVSGSRAGPLRSSARSLGADVIDIYLRPSAVFRGLTRRNRCGGALSILMVVHLLYAFAVLSTGVLDYEIDLATQNAIARLRRQQIGNEESARLEAELDPPEPA